MRDLTPLNNPVWAALQSVHQPLAVSHANAAVYQPNISPLAGMALSQPNEFEDLAQLVTDTRPVWLLNTFAITPSLQWEIQRQRHIDQMICIKPQAHKGETPLQLSTVDVPEMMALVERTQPGPFFTETIRMGEYVGIRCNNGSLVAMAGLRLKADQFTEISAVCTHPDHQGKGYARQLINYLVQKILAEGKLPMLHVKTENTAKQVYQQLGFTVHQEVVFSVLTHAALAN